MPISSTTSKRVFLTDDSTVAFPFPYKFYAVSDLVVTKYTISDGTEDVLTNETDYAVTGEDDGEGGTTYENGGTVTLTAAAGDGYKLIIQRILPLTQEYDYVPNTAFAEDSFEEALDRHTIILQQMQEELNRCLKVDISVTSLLGTYSVSELEDILGLVEIPSFVISELSEKTTLAEDDLFAIADSEDSNNQKSVKKSNLFKISGYSAKTSMHNSDVFLIEDSQASYVKKKVTYTTLFTEVLSDITDLEAEFNTSTGHDHDGSDSKSIPMANLGTGTPGATNFLRGDGSWALPIPNVTAGDVLNWYDDSAESLTPAGTPTTIKGPIRIPRAGVYRVKFDLKSPGDETYNANGAIYKNGSQVGTSRTTTSDTYVTYSEDLTFAAGDYIEIFCWAGNNGTVWVQNFRIYNAESLLLPYFLQLYSIVPVPA